MRILASLPQMVLDSPSASAAGLIQGEKMKMGLTVDPEDSMIMGIAKVASEKVLTRNVKHFSGTEGVRIETY